MIQLVHDNSERVKKIIRNGEEVSGFSTRLTDSFWELAEKYPEDWIVWIDQRYLGQLNEKYLDKIFHHNLIMASFPITSQFLPETIGYIDQLPFVNPDYTVKYPSWRMSADVGGIKAETALAFKPGFHKIENFDYLLNTIAKTGQQNSLFCYTNPALLTTRISQEPETHKASKDEVFMFVYQHYKSIWVWVLFFCYIRYESKFPVLALLKSFFNAKYFLQEIDLSNISLSTLSNVEISKTVDVIIPTMGRPSHLKQVLIDLKEQSHLPDKVIVVEQNPQPDSETQLDYIASGDWPFKIVHHFTHKTGACMARNLALESVDSNFLFLCDDDNRFESDLLKKFLLEMEKLGVEAINTAYPQKADKEKFTKMKQWGTFGSGNSLISWNKKTNILRFDLGFENGYGEDTDYGLQLRARGVDIIYHPGIKITHLKAERGGFRAVSRLPWEETQLSPKPFPTMMLLVKKHYSKEMIKGYKVGLFLKFYFRQDIKNPFTYVKSMKRRWEISEQWAEQLSEKNV